MPASFPGVTAVGGTGFAYPGGLTVNAAGSVTARGTEAVWNEEHNPYDTAIGIYAGGGGVSSVFARPAYQSALASTTCAITPAGTAFGVGTLPVAGTVEAKMRMVPDVSFSAAAGISQYGIFIECTFNGTDCTDTGTDPVVVELGGTSASTPAFAGVVALANQALGGRLGNVNPLLYALNQSTPAAFHDITTGTNEVTCRTADPGCPGNNVLYGYAATTGYDCASGLGSVDATNLVTAMHALTPTTTSVGAAPTATTEGANVTLTATVDVEGTNSNDLGGTATFTFQSYLANGDLDQSWTLGQVAVTGSTTSGTAIVTTAIPPGMVQTNQIGDVYAMYGGDANHLPSYSAKVQITFSGVALCIDPATDGVAKGGAIAYAALGGVPPVRWYIDWDSTCTAEYTECSTINETTGAFTAGEGADGYVIVEALDADGAETFSEVTVGGGAGIVPWSSAGPSNYAGIVVSATAATTCPAGDNCSTVANGCGGSVNCGTCTAPQTCGGGTPSNANECGCTPITTCPAGDNCGTIANGCGGTVNCGTCTTPQTCGGAGKSNQCGCTPITTCPAGDNCGTISNGCGGTVNCGTCTTPQTCGGAGNANQCGCTPITTCPAGDDCGTVPNGCGSTVNCGTCSSTQTCTANKCMSGTGTDAGGGGTDAGSGGTDSGSGSGDSGSGGTDSGSGSADSGSGGADSGSAGTDSGGAGTDSGSAGTDSGSAGTDSGSANEDSGSSEDSGSAGEDSGSANEDSGSIGEDSGVILIGEDASPTMPTDAGEDAANGSGSGGAGSPSGCGCVTAGSRNESTHAGAIGALLFGLAAFGRRRRNRVG